MMCEDCSHSRLLWTTNEKLRSELCGCSLLFELTNRDSNSYSIDDACNKINFSNRVLRDGWVYPGRHPKLPVKENTISTGRTFNNYPIVENKDSCSEFKYYLDN